MTGIKGNAESTYRMGDVNITPENIGALPISGGTATGRLMLEQGSVVKKQRGEIGNGYVRIAQLKITGKYIQTPIHMQISSESWTYSRNITILFKGTDSNDPELSSFYIDSKAPYTVAIAKSAVSTWDIYMQKTSGYGYCNILSMGNTADPVIQISYPDERVTSLPEGYIEPDVIKWDKAKDADTVDGKHASDFILKDGDEVTGELATLGGTVVKRMGGIGGKGGYVNFAHIEITRAYANHPIEFVIGGRGRGITRICVRFHSIDNSDPGLDIFEIEGDCSYPIRIFKTSASNWDLYAEKNESYGVVEVLAMHRGQDSVTITYPNIQLNYSSVVPNPEWIKPTIGGKVKESDVTTKLFGGTDFRNNPTTPNDYKYGLKSSGIKTQSAIGVTDGSAFTQVIGYRAWGDSTVGKAHELGFTGNGNLYHRAGSTTSWEDWREIAHTDDIPHKTSELENDSGYLCYQMITQAEYDALPDTKNSDNVVYFIED